MDRTSRYFVGVDVDETRGPTSGPTSMMRSTWISLLALSFLIGCADTLPPQTPTDEGAGGLDNEPLLHVRIAPGSFNMGSTTLDPGHAEGELLHEVNLTRHLVVQTTEVTQRRWAELVPANPSASQSTCGANCPVERVNWWDTLYYLNLLSAQDGLRACYGMGNCTGVAGRDLVCESVVFQGLDCEGWRLPTEAEWEYIARAGTSTANYNGDLVDTRCADTTLNKIAWYCGTSAEKVHAVGELSPNAFGVFDTSGNVWEWVWDWYQPFDGTPSTDPIGPRDGEARVLRGGGWFSFAPDCRSARRGAAHPDMRSADIGFRAVRTLRPDVNGEWTDAR